MANVSWIAGALWLVLLFLPFALIFKAMVFNRPAPIDENGLIEPQEECPECGGHHYKHRISCSILKRLFEQSQRKNQVLFWAGLCCDDPKCKSCG